MPKANSGMLITKIGESEVLKLKKVSLHEFLRLRKLVYRSARPLDYTKWKILFENGSCDDFLTVLSGYQNVRQIGF